jgi:hypothetical protein
MPNYLLACECGQTQSVGVAQAGGQVVCACGNKLDVPPLRLLRHLPPAADQPAATASAWSGRKGAIAVCLILASLLAALSLWSRLTEPPLPKFDPTDHSEFFDQLLGHVTPVDAWKLWIDQYRPLAERGFAVLERHDTPAIRAIIAQKRFSQTIMLSMAAILAAAAVTIAIWPRAMKG